MGWGVVVEERRTERELEGAVDVVERRKEKERGGTGECSLICQQEVRIGGDGEGLLGEYSY